MPSLSRVAVLALGVALLLGVGLAAGGTTAGQSSFQVAENGPGPNTTMTIELAADGDARWTVSMSVGLDDQADIDSFQSLGSAFEAGTSDVLSIDTFREFAALASEATGREMELTDVSRTATVTNETGRLDLQFTWQHFGRRQGETLEVSDAFSSPSGTWLDGLTANQHLVIEAPESFDITSAPKGFTNKTIRWSGPTRFDPSYLSVTYQIDTMTPTQTQTPPQTQTPTQTRTISPTTTTSVGQPDNSGSLPVAAMFLTVIVLGAVGVYTLRRQGLPAATRPDEDDGDDGGTATDSSSDDGGSSAASVVDEGAVPPSSTNDAEEGATDAQPLDRELLSDEEYVEALIERNGGRMKQATIVTETGWSNAKVSQLLSGMAETGRIEKLRIGRENLISFPDVDNGIEDES